MGISINKELYKLVHKKKYVVMLIIGMLILLCRYGISYVITRVTEGTVAIHTNLPMEILPLLTDLFIPIVVFMAVTDLVATGIQEDTLKADFLRPVTREVLLFSKLAAVLVLAAVYLIVFFVAAAVMQFATGGGFRLAGMSLGAYILDIVPVINVILLAMLINLITEKPSLSMLLCLVVYAVLKYFSLYNGAVSPILFTSYMRWHNIVIGATLPAGALFGRAGIIFGTMLIFGAASVILIDRKNL